MMNFSYRRTRIHNLFGRIRDRFIPKDYKGVVPNVTGERASFEALAAFLIDRAFEAGYDSRQGFFKKSSVVYVGAPGVEAALYEWIARTFIGAGFVFPNGPKPELAKRYAALMRTGVDPASPHYWARIPANQILVENVAAIVGILLNFDFFWKEFSDADKKNLSNYLIDCCDRPFRDNNWLWFKIFHYVFLEKTGAGTYEKKIGELLDRLGSFYRGEGWYNDGAFEHEERFDYYNAWGMHYYGLLFCLLADDGRYGSAKDILKERFRASIEQSLYFLNDKGLPVAYGRSLIYRFGMLAPLGLGIKLGWVDEKLYGRIRSLAASTLNHFIEAGALNGQGLLTLGYGRSNPGIAQWYSSSGSPYWAMKAFSFLLLPAEHPFWKAPAAPQAEKRSLLMPTPGLYVEHDRTGGILLLNGKMNSRTYPREYNKFAYSNRYFPNLSSDYPDHLFTVTTHGKTGMKDTIYEASVSSEGVFTLVWGVKEFPDFRASSVLAPAEGGYRLKTIFSAKEKMHYRFCGFGVRADGPEVSQLKVERGPASSRVGTHTLKAEAALDAVAQTVAFVSGDLEPGDTNLDLLVTVGKRTP